MTNVILIVLLVVVDAAIVVLSKQHVKLEVAWKLCMIGTLAVVIITGAVRVYKQNNTHQSCTQCCEAFPGIKK